MASRQAEALALVARVRRLGWPVVQMGASNTWKVTCPDKVRVQIHATGEINATKQALELLNDHGFAEAEAEFKKAEESARKAKLAAEQERNARRTTKAVKMSAAVAKAAGPYATPEVTITQILARHPAPIVWLKVRITPAMATAMLARNEHNRRESPGEQKDWESKLHTGRVRHTHQGIAFDVLGRLQDGQTRLRSIETSGVPAELMVSAGWPVENFAVADTGRRRTAAQVLSMEGTVTASWIAPAAKLLHLYGVWGHVMLDHTKDRVGNDQILDVIGKLDDQDDMTTAVQVASRLRGQIRKVPPAGIIASIYLIRRAVSPDYESVDAFVEMLVGGVAEKTDPMVFALRRRLTNAAMTPRERLTSAEIMALTLKAWNARIDGRYGATLSVRAGSSMPLPRVPGQLGSEE